MDNLRWLMYPVFALIALGVLLLVLWLEDGGPRRAWRRVTAWTLKGRR